MEAEGADDYSSVGNTRFGGDPDLPADFEWPCTGDPKSPSTQFGNFVAQINFAELPPLSEPSLLPDRGWLFLFVRYMDSAAEPVLLDTLLYDGQRSGLKRRQVPDPDRLCDEYLTDLIPQRIKAVPTLSFPGYRRDYRRAIESQTEEVDGNDGNWRRHDLESEFVSSQQIGQLLGFATAGDERDNLYREVYFGRIKKRNLVYNDYWDTFEEYEADIENPLHKELFSGRQSLSEQYRAMRQGVTWLIENKDTIARAVAEWRLLFRVDSNPEMNLNINDSDPLYVFIRHEDLAKRYFGDVAGEVTQG